MEKNMEKHKINGKLSFFSVMDQDVEMTESWLEEHLPIFDL